MIEKESERKRERERAKEQDQQKNITNLLSVLHARHAGGGASLHAHRIPLRPRGSIALAWVGGTLLGPWRRRALPLALLLRVGVDSTIPLASHLPCLVHRAGGLERGRGLVRNQT